MIRFNPPADILTKRCGDRAEKRAIITPKLPDDDAAESMVEDVSGLFRDGLGIVIGNPVAAG
ncbi:MAG TPA: hypothetical protein VM166_13000 [Gemmatimonadaceae bacterium]|nr:hypothetical protein [Gemmatimonadaceae bacterium]